MTEGKSWWQKGAWWQKGSMRISGKMKEDDRKELLKRIYFFEEVIEKDGKIMRELVDFLENVGDELESELRSRFGEDVHPALQRRLDRDMGTVVESRKLIDKIKSQV